MLPGKTYSPEEIARIVIRRAWLILVALALGTTIAIAVSKRLPDRFRSETLIMLIPQRISETYVKGAVTTRIEDRLNTLENQILSRSRLERIILDLNLYKELRGTVPMEEVVRRMGDNDIVIRIEGKESFRVSYVSHDAETAQATTERLASLFIEENRTDRETLAEDTNQFLSAQLADAKSRLVEQEKKLEEYRKLYGGELPSQVTANLQAIQNEQMRLQNLAESADRARERRLNIERQIADLQSSDPLPVVPSQTAASPNDLAGESTAQQLQVAQARLQNLLLHAKPDHPDVRVMQRTVRDLEARLEAESRRPATASGAVAERAMLPAERLRQQKLRDLQLQLDDIDRQLAEKDNQDRQIRAVVRDYQAKLDAAPKRESELIELTRDYATVQATYQNLLVKREEATLAANLERRNIGEQFKVLDPARIPERPFSPNRLLINVGGAGGGLALGLLLIGFLEYRDSSFKCEDDVMRLLNMPVLAVVPLMISDAEQRTRRWRIALIGVAVIALMGSGAALVVWRLRL